MKDLFYIKEVETNRWCLYIKGCHLCMSALDSKESILASLKRIVIRYKTEGKLMSVVDNMDHPKYYYNKDWKTRKEQEYLDSGRLYEEDVESVVSEALREIKESAPIRSLHKKYTPLTTGVDTKPVPSAPIKETKEETPIVVVTNKKPLNNILTRRLKTIPLAESN